jgi:predicted transcriptional regulator YdeE
MSLSPIVKYLESFLVTGFSVRTQNSDEFNEKTAKIPSLWQQFYSSELAGSAKLFGVYSNFESDENGPYTVTVGAASTKEQSQLSSVRIQAGNYLIFQGTGPMPQTVIEAWQRIWTFFQKTTEYRRNFISDFEAYSGSDQVAVYIGVD